MGLSARVEPLGGKLPQIAFKWDPETEILSGQFKGLGKATGLTGSIELEGHDGSFIVLDVVAGAVRGLEVVVWPESSTAATLAPPKPASRGRLLMPSRPSQPGIAAVEVETAISVEKSADEATIHLRIGPWRKIDPVQLANNLIIEVDAEGEIAGFWLLNVPPFPRTKEVLE